MRYAPVSVGEGPIATSRTAHLQPLLPATPLRNGDALVPRSPLWARRTRVLAEMRRRTLRATFATAGVFKAVSGPGYAPAEAAFIRRWRGDLRREHTLLHTFAERYDDLVDVLCLAAQQGTNRQREVAYQGVRAWFVAHYPRIKSRLLPLLREIERDGSVLSVRRAWDGFEMLFAPHDLAALLQNDRGDLIERLMVTQEGIARWRTDLMRRERLAGGLHEDRLV